nr:unnamed protein product [Digitaria exilis]
MIVPSITAAKQIGHSTSALVDCPPSMRARRWLLQPRVCLRLHPPPCPEHAQPLLHRASTVADPVPPPLLHAVPVAWLASPPPIFMEERSRRSLAREGMTEKGGREGEGGRIATIEPGRPIDRSDGLCFIDDVATLPGQGIGQES